MNEEFYTALASLTLSRLAEIKATQEIILKAQARFVAQLAEQPWEPIFEDLRQQAREAAEVYRLQILNELDVLRARSGRRRAGEGPAPPPTS